MPCYRCGTRQGDPEPGKGSPWRRGVISEHQVLICPACQPAVLAELARCPGCGSAHLIRRLDQVECLDCRLTRDADEDSGLSGAETAPDSDIPDISVMSDSAPIRDPGLAAEVARALDRLRGRP
ncbi:hypothetical protein [Trebonia sp.]|uniref:hypothetical protein n=2 Tax=Trebonia sp. TaxID=2767075 RepID=UPI003BB1AE6F